VVINDILKKSFTENMLGQDKKICWAAEVLGSRNTTTGYKEID
jgi:hypothetical protein